MVQISIEQLELLVKSAWNQDERSVELILKQVGVTMTVKAATKTRSGWGW